VLNVPLNKQDEKFDFQNKINSFHLSTFCQISSNVSTPSATFFRQRSISPKKELNLYNQIKRKTTIIYPVIFSYHPSLIVSLDLISIRKK